MYRPNFCAECGERLARRGWRALFSGRFCVACARKRGRAVIAKPIVILAITAISSFALGRYLRPPAPPLLIQRAGNSPLSDLPVNLNDTARTTNRKESASTNQNAAALNPQAADETGYICGARTKKGTPCHRRVHAAGERCFQHKGMPAILPLEKLEVKSK
jgi:hypothetical protein